MPGLGRGSLGDFGESPWWKTKSSAFSCLSGVWRVDGCEAAQPWRAGRVAVLAAGRGIVRSAACTSSESNGGGGGPARSHAKRLRGDPHQGLALGVEITAGKTRPARASSSTAEATCQQTPTSRYGQKSSGGVSAARSDTARLVGVFIPDDLAGIRGSNGASQLKAACAGRARPRRNIGAIVLALAARTA